jgi:DNA-nicking Smr family endonuclease
MVKQRSTHHVAADDAAADAKIFRAAVRDVRPLAQTPAADIAAPRPRARRRNTTAPAAEHAKADMPLIDGPTDDAESVTADGTLSFQRPGVRIQVMRRLRRGLYPIDGELDLHGLSQTAARDKLADFIAHSRDSGCRCVSVIHGKGYRSGARGPILKSAVNLWLRRHLDVMAFVSARAIDGGAGALYVLLRA